MKSLIGNANSCILILSLLAGVCRPCLAQVEDLVHLSDPPAKPLTMEGDIADLLLSGVDRFLLDEIAGARNSRSEAWSQFTGILSSAIESNPSISPPIAWDWIEQQRTKLRICLGIRDAREPFSAVEILKTTNHSGVVARGPIVMERPRSDPREPVDQRVWQGQVVRWPVLPGVFAEGLLLEPVAGQPVANVVVIPDADQTPEQIAGLSGSLPFPLQTAGILATAGCRVLVPTLISRDISARGPPGEAGRAELSNRELVYRPAFELGRHILGYEIQKVLAAVDWFAGLSPQERTQPKTDSLQSTSAADAVGSTSIGVVGYGEGGLIALCCGALDERIDDTVVLGAFGPRERMWQEPICRNLFGFLSDFGDAELAAMIWPRQLVVGFTPGPQVSLQSRGGAPGKLEPHRWTEVAAEFHRAASILGIPLPPGDSLQRQPVAAVLTGSNTMHGAKVPASAPSILDRTHGRSLSRHALWLDSPQKASAPDQIPIQELQAGWALLPNHYRSLLVPVSLPNSIQLFDPAVDPLQRQNRQVTQLIEHTQRLLAESSRQRDQRLNSLDTTSLENYQTDIQHHRKQFYEEVIGRFSQELLPANPRARQAWRTEKWTGYEVVLDVWPNVIAFGVLLLPNDLQKTDKRPVVVCQHGLEGRPTDVFLGDHPAYHDFAAKLCERGYIVFAPQNLYLMEDRFRTLQRKANSIGKSLFSIIIPQHQQILNWLKTIPQVDSSRIAFYGLSYGGKSAMRIPAVVQDYCLSICSADFNEWIVKNASTTESFSYVWTGEYEIFEYNLGNTFGYAEMAALICPRPFMVERGHFDAVAVDQWVGYEYAKVRHLYQARLGIGDRTAIEWFVGPHTINGQQTFQFLDRHLHFSPK